MKKLFISIGIIIILVVAAIIIFVPREPAMISDDKYIGHSVEECSRIQEMCIQGMQRFDDETGCGCEPVPVPDGWKMYTNNDMGFSMAYDPSLTVQQDNDNEVRFYRNGPTQKGQTEMYDGMLLSVQKITAPEGVQAYIDTHIKEVAESSTITAPLRTGMLNGLSIQTFDASGLGDFTTIFIPVDDANLFELSYMVVDPTNAGFQETMDAILSSISLIQ